MCEDDIIAGGSEPSTLFSFVILVKFHLLKIQDSLLFINKIRSTKEADTYFVEKQQWYVWLIQWDNQQITGTGCACIYVLTMMSIFAVLVLPTRKISTNK